MPYNQDLEKKLDLLTVKLGEFTKKKMFGGVGYMMNGNMVFGIHKESLLIRTSPEKEPEMLKQNGVSIFDMTGRPMKGWLLIAPPVWKTDQQLLGWLNIAIDYVIHLPGK